MAQRRMFSLQIVDTDAFLEMPATAQLLYFHLAMRADDDGFVDNPKKIMKSIGSADDDIKVLLSKRFILTFENGIIVIKHWKMHNYIQNDRYHETKYLDEKKKLIVKDNGAYTECIQPVSIMEAEVRLGKVRLGKEIPAANAALWDFKSKLAEMQKSTRRDIQVIAVYWLFKGIEFENEVQYEAALKRELRAAGKLKGYDDGRINGVMEWLNENCEVKWTLETVHKYIDDNLDAIPKKTKKQNYGTAR